MTKAMTTIRTAYDGTRVHTDDLEVFEPSLTQQHFLEECDFNNVMHTWQVSGLIQHVNPQQPRYGDFSMLTDFSEALEIVRSAEDAFLALPSKLRASLGNDPAELVGWLSDPDNRQQAIKYGLISEAPAAERAPDAGVAAGASTASPEAVKVTPTGAQS